jgi:AcrR family transcriptional regulator
VVTGGDCLDSTQSTKARILEAARHEFGIYGYKSASTNRIYLLAGVSKGVIFKIFKSKAELFYTVFMMAIDEMMKERESVDLDSLPDAFEKIMRITEWKIEYAGKHKEATNVMLEGVSNPPEAIKAKVQEQMDKLKDLSIYTFFADIPMDNIRSEFTREDVMRYMDIALVGIQAKYMNQPLTIDYMASIREDCIKFIKTILKGMT